VLPIVSVRSAGPPGLELEYVRLRIREILSQFPAHVGRAGGEITDDQPLERPVARRDAGGSIAGHTPMVGREPDPTNCGRNRSSDPHVFCHQTSENLALAW